MANTVTSNTFNTSNTFIKYQIVVTDNGNSTVDVQVKAWRTNSGYTTNRDGKAWVRIGSTSHGNDLFHEETTWRVPDKPVSQNSYTIMYSRSNISIDTTRITDNKIYVDASLEFYGSPQYTSSWQGFAVEIGAGEGSPIAAIVPVNIYPTSVSLSLIASETCNEWWYIVQDKNGDVLIDWTKFSEESGLSQNLTIRPLESNTEYLIQCDVRSSTSGKYCDSKPAYKTRTTQDIPNIGNRITIFDIGDTDFTSNGLGSLPDVASCTVTEERNGIFELEMEYPITGYNFDYIDHRRILLAKPNPYAKPQPFRIYAITKPFNGLVTVYATHISYDLTGYTVGRFSGTNVTESLNNLNLNIDVDCPFEFWTNKTTNGIVETTKPLTVKSVLGGIEGSILDIYHGEYEWDGFHVKLWEQRGMNRGVHISYGKNLTDIKQEENCNNMYTAVRPYWYKEEESDGNKTYTLVELPDDATTPNHCIAVSENPIYPKILLLDLSSQFDDKPSISDIITLTNLLIANSQMTAPEVSISVSFVSLDASSEYDDIKELEKIQLCDTVIVDFPKLKVTRNGVKCVKTVYNVLEQRYDSIDLGVIQTYITDTISNHNKEIRNSITKEEFAEAMAKA